ncbi:ketopantoate reductase C-terminal domain-containing protein [Nocardioides sp. SYSU D00038]|uniref:ketopantoate reductase C-terminal domain-containing protein n=1 Tax=Nocardioides sp. SYSU D00038 TaxID=2812554 RepID=UPI0035B179E3
MAAEHVQRRACPRPGLATEVDHRAGELVLLGRLHGVPTPACERVVAAARPPVRTPAK